MDKLRKFDVPTQDADRADALDHQMGRQHLERRLKTVRSLLQLRSQGSITNLAKLVGRAGEVGTVSSC